jgi:SPP1 family predicted phage head-tail adaptor
MRAGSLKHRVLIQEPVEERDASGGVTRTWQTVATRRAEIRSLTGRELTLARQARSSVNVQVRMRRWPDLTSRHRLVEVDGEGEVLRTLDVDATLDVAGTGRELLVLCVEA